MLVIDDEEIVRFTLVSFLELFGCEVEAVRYAKEGITAYRERPPDAVVVDMLLEGGSGMDVIRQLQELDPDVRVLAITGWVGKEDLLEQATELGAKATLRKPFTKEQIQTAMEEVLE